MFDRARDGGLIGDAPELAVDATGLETRHASRYFVLRAGYDRFPRLRWPKLSLACHTRSHLIAAAVVTDGPSQDSPQFPAVMRQAAPLAGWRRVLADAAYDGEHNHRLCREGLGIPETVIALNPRNAGRRWPRTPYRRAMRQHFPKAAYDQRWQVESAIARHKRRLGPGLRARSPTSQADECLLRVVTHNLMLLAA